MSGCAGGRFVQCLKGFYVMVIKGRMVKRKMVKNAERRWRSKVAVGLRVKIPKDIADIYEVKKDDIVEWIYDGEENIKIEIKEMVLREKKAKVEEVSERRSFSEK